MRSQVVGVMLGLVLLMHGAAGCAPSDEPDPSAGHGTSGSEPGATTPADPDTAAAVWRLARNQDVSNSRITVMVTRLGCNSGVTGEVMPPAVVQEGEQTVITFVVAPGEPAAATCQGNPWVRYRLDLGEQWASSTLVDGQCLPDGEAVGTSFCNRGGVRHRATS